MYNYLVYALWLVIPAAVVSALPYVVCVLLCCSVRLRSSTAGMVKFLLGDLVEKKEEEDGTKYLIKGHPLKGKFLSIYGDSLQLHDHIMCFDDILGYVFSRCDLQL